MHSIHTFLRAAPLSTALAFGVLSSGCADPDGAFTDFEERLAKVDPQTTSSTSSGGECASPAAGEPDGEFLFALSAKLSPKKPIVFLGTFTTAAAGDGIELTMSLQPLDRFDRKTPVGTLITVPAFPIAADGTFSATFPPVDVTGDANPITGNDLEGVNVTLTGSMCAPGTTMCGTADGTVTSPPVGLTGSTFTAERIETAGVYPDPPMINCAGDLAGSL